MKPSSVHDRVVAVLYQSSPTPAQGGIRKPAKPGGYRDSAADIAYALRQGGVSVVTPNSEADPARDLDWAFGDERDGIKAALDAGASLLWANTTLYDGHPLTEFANNVGVVGQSIALVDRFEDKWVMNQWLRSHQFPVPNMWTLRFLDVVPTVLPLVLKPRRGRGSQGVQRIESRNDIPALAPGDKCLDAFVVEEYLPGEEVTISVMPPGSFVIDNRVRKVSGYWALPPVMRRYHRNGIIPYSGEVAVLDNSLVDHTSSMALEQLVSNCEAIAARLYSRAWLRIDARQDPEGVYRIMDVNFKPNLTGPGRPGRDRDVSLVAMAAASYGWSYSDLVTNLLQSQDWTLPF